MVEFLHVAYEPGVTEAELKPLVHKVPFALEVPTVLEASSVPDTLPTDVPDRLYTIVPGHKALVLVYHTGGNDFWDIEETDWGGAPIFQGRSFTHVIDGRTFQLQNIDVQTSLIHSRRGYDDETGVGTPGPKFFNLLK